MVKTQLGTNASLNGINHFHKLKMFLQPNTATFLVTNLFLI